MLSRVTLTEVIARGFKPETWACMPAPPITGHKTLDKSPTLSELLFCRLENKDNNFKKKNEIIIIIMLPHRFTVIK